MTTKNNKTGAVKVTKYTIKVDKTKLSAGDKNETVRVHDTRNSCKDL